MAITKTHSRMVSDVNADINVKDYGATGDGSTNDHAAFESFFAAISGKRGCIPASATDYIITTDSTGFTVGAGTELYIERGATIHCNNNATAQGFLNLNGNGNIFIHGGGRIKGPQSGATVAYSATQTAISKTDTADVNNIVIDGIEIDGWGDNAVDIKNCSDADVRFCRIYDCGRGGVFFKGCDYSEIQSNHIHDITPGSGGSSPFINAYGVSATTDTSDSPALSSTGVIIRDNIIRNVPSWEGIDIHGVTDFRITNNIVLNCMIGAFIGPSTGTNDITTHRGICNDNLFYTTATYQRAAIILAPSDDVGTIWGKTFTIGSNVIVGHGRNQNTYDNGFTGTEGAIEVVGCQDVAITGNSIKDAYCVGIHLEQEILGCTVMGNQVTDMNGSGVGGSETATCLRFAQSANSIANVDGNTFQRLTGTSDGVEISGTPSTTYGIRYGQENTFIGTFSDNFLGSSVANMHEDSRWLSSGGKVLQVVQTSLTAQSNLTSTSLADSGHPAASLTPATTGSKVLINYTGNWGDDGTASLENLIVVYRQVGGGGYSALAGTMVGRLSSSGVAYMSMTINFLDSPNTTSQVDYKIYYKVSGGTAYNNYNWSVGVGNPGSNLILTEIGA